LNDQTDSNEKIGTKYGGTRMRNWVVGGLAMVLIIAVAAVMAWRSYVSYTKEGSLDDPIVIEMKPGGVKRSAAIDYYEMIRSDYESDGYDLNDPDLLTEIKTAALIDLAQRRIADIKIEEMKLNALTDEDRANAQRDAQAEFDGAVEMYAPFFQNEEGTLTDDELRAEVLKYFEEQQITLEGVTQYYLSETPTQRLLESIYKDVIVTDEETEAAFQSRAQEHKELYGGDVPNYEIEREYYGVDVLYTPPGYRGVRHILLAPDGELQSRLEALDEELYTLKGELIELQYPQDFATGDGSANLNSTHVDDTPATPEPDQEAINAKAALIEAKTAELELAREGILPSVEPIIAEIQEKLEAGESFSSLIEQYGSDPGMEEEPAKSGGYPVHAQSVLYDEAFQQGAMALESIGDVSEPILSSFGVHILEYTRDVPEGFAELTDARREEFSGEALAEKRNAAIDAQFDIWMSDYGVVIHPDLL
jgi:parvulin-like peptidyl-prolyl isomerase